MPSGEKLASGASQYTDWTLGINFSVPLGLRAGRASVRQTTLLIARASRSAILHSIEEHDRAVRGLLQREELLKEAKLELERALEIGGIGRFTDEVRRLADRIASGDKA